MWAGTWNWVACEGQMSLSAENSEQGIDTSRGSALVDYCWEIPSCPQGATEISNASACKWQGQRKTGWGQWRILVAREKRQLQTPATLYEVRPWPEFHSVISGINQWVVSLPLQKAQTCRCSRWRCPLLSAFWEGNTEARLDLSVGVRKLLPKLKSMQRGRMLAASATIQVGWFNRQRPWPKSSIQAQDNFRPVNHLWGSVAAKPGSCSGELWFRQFREEEGCYPIQLKEDSLDQTTNNRVYERRSEQQGCWSQVKTSRLAGVEMQFGGNELMCCLG